MHRYAAATFLCVYSFALVSIGSDYNENFLRLVTEEFKEIKALLKNPNFDANNFIGGGYANVLRAGHSWRTSIEPTPSQPEGPFYPIRFPVDTDSDLTRINDGEQAFGTVVYVQGQVLDLSGNVIKDAFVQIWQACASGRYNHPSDPNPREPDPNFQGYSGQYTDANGQYIFKTIVPGPYPASANWWRPPHIHFKISHPEFKTTTTQLYFNGDSFSSPITRIDGKDIGADEINQYNRDDLILKRLSAENQGRLIVRFQDAEGIKLGIFNIYLTK